jgi:hypothetical protein
MASRIMKISARLSLVLQNRRIMHILPIAGVFLWSMISEAVPLEEQPLNLLCALSPSTRETDPRVPDNPRVNEHAGSTVA